MSRRMILLGLAVFASQLASGCCTQRGAMMFPRLNAMHCGGACAPPVVPYSPVIRGPLLPRPLLYGPVPVGTAPAYGAPIGDPSCSSCNSSPGVIASTPKVIYGAGGPVYAGGVPHDSVLLPSPTVIPPGTPKVEQTTEPKPMPK